VRVQPEFIVFADDHVGAASEIADLRARPVWRDLVAVETGHVVNIDEAIVRPSPGLVDAIEHLARELHPEVFPGAQETLREQGNKLLAVQLGCRERLTTCGR
jgi:ABC-type Fe3+-hydroxamate transport system substrate-binding protein